MVSALFLLLTFFILQFHVLRRQIHRDFRKPVSLFHSPIYLSIKLILLIVAYTLLLQEPSAPP